MRHLRSRRAALVCVSVLAVAMPLAAQYPAGRDARLGPMLDAGLISFDTPELELRLVRSSGTVAALLPKGTKDFDFAPSELLAARSTDGYYHLGDLDLRVRAKGSAEWHGYSTAFERHPVRELTPGAGEFAKQDLGPTLPADIPLAITRTWAVADGKLALRFTLKNNSGHAVEIGALGIPLVFDNILSGKSLEQAHAICSFSDPSIARDAGYVQVTRLSGHGPALLVVPDGHTPLEAYRPIEGAGWKDKGTELFHDKTPRTMTFEGFYEWMSSSAAYKEKEWKNVEEWNPATSIELAPGEERTVGLRFLVAPAIESIESTLTANRRPVAVGLPGYILPQDQQASLFLNYGRPVSKIDVEPQGAVTVEQAGRTAHGWQHYTLRGAKWGRARLTITYADDTVQTVQYRVTQPESEAVNAMGNFLFTKQWFDVKDDPFHRSPSIMSYDCEANSIVSEDSRVWIAGLSDEAGAGSFLAAAMKELVQPDKQEVAQLEQFVDQVMWGGIQFNAGDKKYGVRKSLFYYEPSAFPTGTYRSDLDWKSWTSWNKEASEDTGRSFNYPHVVSVYWVLYRLARDHQGLASHHDWRWYLTQSYETSMAMTRFAPDYGQFGQMEGDVFVAVLDDLKREGMQTEAAQLEEVMRKRAAQWEKLEYPFGSEMPWDSTGQEEVYAWTRYFGMNEKAQVTLDAVTGYMPTLPSWGYNGSARRYWDFLYGGKYSRIERQLHHYGSGINAIPMLDAYRRDPSDLYRLRVGYGGSTAPLTNIDQRGCASAAFHSYPDRMEFDPYTGDYGPNFFGHAWTVASYLVHDKEFGWIAFGGDLDVSGGTVRLEPKDSARQRVYLVPLGLWLTLDSGRFASVTYDAEKGTVLVKLDAADTSTTAALLRVEQPAKIVGVGSYGPDGTYTKERGGYTIPLSAQQTAVQLSAYVAKEGK